MGSKAFFRLLFCGVCDENKVLIEMRDYLISISRTFIIIYAAMVKKKTAVPLISHFCFEMERIL